jgi:predicted DNA-binding ArsR family transcriptional regulator
MEKTRIKAILRENLMGAITETEPKEESGGEPNKNYEKDYAEVQTKLQNTMLKQSQVMAAAGLGNPKDATDRSLFSKKVRKDKNDEGGQYLFNDKELASVIKVLNNPAAYLNVKKK